MTSLETLGLDPLALLAKLQRARATGALEITYEDVGVRRTVKYKSDAELAAAIAAIEADLAGKPSVSVAYLRSTKGFL